MKKNLNNEKTQSSREEPSSPTRAPGIRQLPDTLHLDAVYIKKSGNQLIWSTTLNFLYYRKLRHSVV